MEYFSGINSISVYKSITNLLLSLPSIPVILSVIVFLIQSQKNHKNYANKNFWLNEYDYVVIGAGSAGSVMASRLSEDPTKTVLLLEAGPPENIFTDIPELALFLQQTPIDWAFLTEPQNKSYFGLKERRGRWPRGKVMGGSSTINTMIYMRGNPRDYDKWAFDGSDGWSWADIFPYFIKAENNIDEGLVDSGYHGKGGPLTVTYQTYRREISKAFVESGPYLGYSNSDPNGQNQTVFSLTQATILDGQRLSVANAYLERCAKNRTNLQILTNTFVTKIIFDDNKRAVGVEFIKNELAHEVKVRKEVILSAGTIMSPKILMLSGVGPAQHLESLGIDVVSDLPVGDNLQEHVASSMTFLLNDSVGINIIEDAMPSNILEYYVNKNNSLSSNAIESIAFVNTKYANKSEDWPDIQLHVVPLSFASDYGIRLKTIFGLTDELYQTFEPFAGQNAFTILPTLLRPKSRGWIRLRTTNPFDPPVIDPNFFDNEYDLDVLVDGMKIALAIGQTPSLQKYGATPLPTLYHRCREFTIYSEPYLRCMCQTFTSVIFHPMGTCKMGAVDDETAVVDTNLRVKGVTGLRVVDASVIPSPISGNTNAPVVAIAEKIVHQMKGIPVLPMSKTIIN